MNVIDSGGKNATLKAEFWIMAGQLERKALKSSFVALVEFWLLDVKGTLTHLYK